MFKNVPKFGKINFGHYSRGRFNQHFARLFGSKKFEAFFGELRLANGAQILQILGHEFGKCSYKNDGEIEWRIFHQMLCAGNFSLDEKSLMKSTPGKEQIY